MAKNMANMEGDKLISLVPTQNSLDVAAMVLSKYGIDPPKGIPGSTFISITKDDDSPENGTT